MNPVLKSFFTMLGITAALIIAYTAWSVQQGTTLAELSHFILHTTAGTVTIAGIVVLFLIGWAMLSWNFRIFAEQAERNKIAEEKRREEEEENQNNDKAEGELPKK